MLQSSITAWLKKPSTVARPEERTSTPAHANHEPAPAPLPPPLPPQSSDPLPDTEPPNTSPASTETGKICHVSPKNNFSLPPLPPNVQLVPLTEDLMPGFKRLTALTLPISYPSSFFAESMTEPIHSITLIALWQTASLASGSKSNPERPRVVGAIRCRLLPSSILYISTISLLAPYRSHGIASHLLQNVVSKASSVHGIRSVTAHVWEANEDGLEWYEKRGFEIIGKEEKYYNKLRPSGAVLVRKWVGVSDLLASVDTTSTAST